jgi:hypothetical protein
MRRARRLPVSALLLGGNSSFLRIMLFNDSSSPIDAFDNVRIVQYK